MMKMPFVVMVSGLPGSGKSYFSGRLAERLKATYLSSDQIRKSLFDTPNYTLEEKEQVYHEMGNLMAEALKRRETVVLDGTFHLKSIRQQMKEKIAEGDAGYAMIHIKANEALIEERTSQKRKESDADYEVYLMLKKAYEPIEDAFLKLISTNENIEEMLQQAMNYLAIEYDKTRD